MKNICRVHTSTLIFYIILILSGYINYLLIYLTIIITHELGHIIMIKLLKLKINSLTIYPFGGVITTNINYNINSNKLFLVSIAGITMQLVLFLLFKDIENYEIFKTLNLSIIIFNLITIIPSDGSKIATSFLERFISYRSTLIITNIISILSLVIVFLISKNLLFFVVLYYLNIKTISSFKYIINKFKLERYLYKKKYKKNIYIEDEKHMKKCRNNYIKYDNIYVEEDAYLNHKFTKIYWHFHDFLVSSIMFVSIHYKPH